MRYIIAFLLLFILNFVKANALQNKLVTETNRETIKPSFSSKKEIHSLNYNDILPIADRIHQNIQHLTLSPINFLESIISLKLIAATPTKVYKRINNFSYQFIFNCLFPKHTFW